jgi:radical SAM protein with 4Fe4S-binding SPASM domain
MCLRWWRQIKFDHTKEKESMKIPTINNFHQSLKKKSEERKRLRSILSEINSPGLYHYLFEANDERTRVHLRVDPDGSGFLLVNANQVMHLNQTAAIMARLSLEEFSTTSVLTSLTDRFRISKSQAKKDYAGFQKNLDDLIQPNGPCPIHDMDLEIEAPFSIRPSAPYRMDLALTYRCNNDCAHCYNARPRDYPEMDTNHWKNILDQLWELGIPHIIFTGGEPTLRSDLLKLIQYAEDKGQITGLNTNGRRLSDNGFVKELVSAGLDHVQITLESHDPIIHNNMVSNSNAWKQTVAGIKNAVDSSLYVMTNTTMLKDNSPYLDKTLDFLSEIRVPTVGLNALIYAGKGKEVGTGLSEKELKPLLKIAKDKTNQNNQRLIWYTPTQYCNFDPMELDLGIKGCTAALYNMCIEPNGEVLPCQSFYHSLGNFLEESWDSIWNHKVAVALRERHFIQDKCYDCALLPECGGGCPLLIDNFDEMLRQVNFDLSFTLPERIGGK